MSRRRQRRKRFGRAIARRMAWAIPGLAALIAMAEARGVRVWLLGRDMDVFYKTFRDLTDAVGYLTGFNRENSRRLARRGLFVPRLREAGVRRGDWLVDSGFHGSIFERIAESALRNVVRHGRNGDVRFVLSLRLYLLSRYGSGPRVIWHDSAKLHIKVRLIPGGGIGKASGKRVAVLAMEHAPKEERVGWDAKRRAPVAVPTARHDESVRNYYAGFIDVARPLAAVAINAARRAIAEGGDMNAAYMAARRALDEKRKKSGLQE